MKSSNNRDIRTGGFPISAADDQIGNRLASSNSTISKTYGSNPLNQYTNISGAVTNSPTYDDDGNMLSNGDWTYTWNGENRMIGASNGSTVVTMAYDYVGRMFSKTKNGTNTLYTWNGYNIIAEISSGTTNYNVWGLDLSQSMQGAGGVGGLLAVVEDGTAFFACYDANGNITDYVDGSGAVQAHYEYNPFGGISASSQSKKDDFSHRFSTKPYDADTGLIRYELRDCSAGLGRWISRDPVGEMGGPNLYGYVKNRAQACHH